MRFLFSSFFACILLISCDSPTYSHQQNSKSKHSDTDSTIADNKSTDVNNDSVHSESNWSYSDDVDKMDGTKTYWAITQSTNTVDFDFPYNGGSTFELTVRKRKGGNDVLLSVSKGQFISDIDGGEGRIKFDDEKPMPITYVEPNDGTSNLIFLSPVSKIISKLKKAKKVVIEARFFEAGNKQAEFDVDGLKWNH